MFCSFFAVFVFFCFFFFCFCLFFFQAEDGIRYLVRSRGLGDVYKRQPPRSADLLGRMPRARLGHAAYAVARRSGPVGELDHHCLLYTSDAADERSSVDLGGRRIIKKKKNATTT